MKSIYKLEFKLFFRNRSTWIGIVVLLLTGAMGLYFGKTFIATQEKAIQNAGLLQKKNTEHNISHFGKDIGLVFFHNKFSMANMPDAWAAFANGQRDVNPYLISATMLALEGQIYDTDITNPVSLLFGNMDLSFVFIFLFPLVIIAFSYNLVSEDRESGVWSILKSQTNHLAGVIWKKLVVRAAVIFVTSLMLLVMAVGYLALPIDLTLLFVAMSIWLYLVFWFVLCFFIVSLSKSSSYNASALVAIWVMLCVVAPATLNLVLTQRYPVPEALQNVVNQREGYHEKWDMPKSATMEPFFKHYPQLRQYPFPADKSFSWFWYYGMQQMGDDQAIESRNAIGKKLNARQGFTNLAAMFLPSIQTQLAVNEVSGTDLAAHLSFQKAYRKYHEQTRLHFYPAIFLEKDIHSTDILAKRLQLFSAEKIYMWQRMIPVLVLIIILSGLTLLNLRKIQMVK